MFNALAVSTRELELESAELLPSRETLCVTRFHPGYGSHGYGAYCRGHGDGCGYGYGNGEGYGYGGGDGCGYGGGEGYGFTEGYGYGDGCN